MARSTLPDEIVLLIQQSLSPAQRLQTAPINSQWRRCAEDEPYWRRAFERDCLEKGAKRPCTLPAGVDHWLHAYRLYGEAERARGDYYAARRMGLMQPFRKLLVEDLASVFDPGVDMPWQTAMAGIGFVGTAANWYLGTPGHVWQAYKYSGAGFVGAALGAWVFPSNFFVHTIATGAVAFWAMGSAVFGPTHVAASVLKHIPAYVHAWRKADAVNAITTARLTSASERYDTRRAAFKALMEDVKVP